MLTSNETRSEKQIEASRINGAKSHGPVTDEGKLHSSRNAITHGLLAKTVVLDGESKERFAKLLFSLQQELQPETTVERHLIETMAVCRWRQIRIWGMEKAAVVREVCKLDPADGPATRTTQAYRSLNDESRWLETMNRYEVRFDRQYGRAFRAFREYRAARRQKNDFPRDEPQNL